MSKRKKDFLTDFDPNKSDPEDENFDPIAEKQRTPRSARKQANTRRPKNRGAAGGARRRNSRYKGSDIEDDEDISDSEQDISFGEEEDEEEEEDSDAPVNATGRRMRQAAARHQSYRESSEDEDGIQSSDQDKDVVQEPDEEHRVPSIESPEQSPSKKKSRIVVLSVKKGAKPSSQRPRRAAAAKEPATMVPPTRRSTRARTEETDEPLLELSNSGRHTRVTRASTRSKSPEAMTHATRATRGSKGVKKQQPPPIPEASHEEDDDEFKVETDIPNVDDVDELAGQANMVDAPADHPDEHQEGGDEEMVEEGAAQQVSEEQPAQTESQPAAEDADGDDEDDRPITRRTRGARAVTSTTAASTTTTVTAVEPEGEGLRSRLRRGSRLKKRSLAEPSSDFEPGEESGDNEGYASEASVKKSGRKGSSADESAATPVRGRSTRARAAKRPRRNQDSGDEEVELDREELAEELEELRESSRSRPRRAATRRRRSPSIQYEQPAGKRRRTTQRVDYTIPAIDLAALEAEEDEEPVATPARGRKRNGGNAGWDRPLNTTYGPFGGAGIGALLGGPWGTGATGGVDSDSSDDEMVQRTGPGQNPIGMTPTSAAPAVGLFNPAAQTHNVDGLGGIGGATPNVGKVKNLKAFADADPLGVDTSVDFSKVGGLQGHIDQLKEMVQLPLLYPELFTRFHVTPPRGVLFHGPPGTGKTLLARALANSVGSGGRKISFYMRKGADALSKWVGEAEKQLRLLFEEARRTQPSIIFFDEIDGLAPVRSSKQEQIHASIVSTLLALMDGMDGRGQVIVIGATNRPDNIDPALRRPGRFDREFYFPLPDIEGRRSILEIHTKDWGLSNEFKDQLAEFTKGYGGADLRALCTEAALNAIQRTYPQIYTSKEKLVVNPQKINIQASDFMHSIKKMVPSSERSASSSAMTIPKMVKPLLEKQFEALVAQLDKILPRSKKTTALEEAMFEPYKDFDGGFEREQMSQDFQRSRVYRPRLLLCGGAGMGHGYLSKAVLHYLEGVHVQDFGLPVLLNDSRPPEQVIVSLFTEVRRHKPSVIFIPNVDAWWTTLGYATLTTFTTMLRQISPTDPVLVFGTAESMPDLLPPEMLTELFGFSKKNRAAIWRPDREQRVAFFLPIIQNLWKAPEEFPDPSSRKKRVLEILPVAPPPPPRVPTKEEIKAQRQIDFHHLNLLKARLQPIMDQIQRRYRKFRQPVIPLNTISYLFQESDPNFVRPDVGEQEQRPFVISKDDKGVDGILETKTGKFYYNLDSTTIEERLANGYYARPMDFYEDIKRLFLDVKTIGDKDYLPKASEMVTNVEIDVYDINLSFKAQGINFEDIYQRQLERTRKAEERHRKKAVFQPMVDKIQSDLAEAQDDSESQGPVGIGFPMNKPAHTTAARFQVITSPKLTGNPNSSGSHPLTNGTSHPSNQGETGQTVEEESTLLFSQGVEISSPLRYRQAQRQLQQNRVIAEINRETIGTFSQTSALTSVPPGVSQAAIQNDASSTRTSDPSSGRGEWNTQQTNGVQSISRGTSQLLESQETTVNPPAAAFPVETNSQSQSQSNSSSSGPWPHSQMAGIAQGILLPAVPEEAEVHDTNEASAGGLRSSSSKDQPQQGSSNDDSQNSKPSNDDSQNSKPSNDTPDSQRSLLEARRLRDLAIADCMERVLQGPVRPGSTGGKKTDSSPYSNNSPALGRNNALLPFGRRDTSVSSQQQPILNDGKVCEFWSTLVDRTAGCNIEQMEQIHRELMDAIWQYRHEWNRMRVLSTLADVFDDTVTDIELVQGILIDAQGREQRKYERKELEKREAEAAKSSSSTSAQSRATTQTQAAVAAVPVDAAASSTGVVAGSVAAPGPAAVAAARGVPTPAPTVVSASAPSAVSANVAVVAGNGSESQGTSGSGTGSTNNSQKSHSSQKSKSNNSGKSSSQKTPTSNSTSQKRNKAAAEDERLPYIWLK
ncbi:hypothetical protein NEUTE1DRAFT_129460 [Neurospora tetrasperma FGSC 2508]|uniref:AAA+ ATPase domain-containing protein n=1 Tax=Neurospora tetrasperma (strain FGSC 2508 / ATCC MYA-4615 / P0657) TaxID=510951 RepID=F8ML62_NEUT8|nr:uncharacterized protein NEUTE1DRAFT_129460 [Neurospora tetrasperma FGSC 2508]EGO57537.1 hypothetical protein NEUTE1DRAFT_129460 [Neurospora tetrasperma FGSC 2508]EGZ72204.1 hypothetical protein NEUTE2DRAFT_111606 [Neurospora tetrasperma FGSC 2509]